MTKREIAALICKAFGIYCFIGALHAAQPVAVLGFGFVSRASQGRVVAVESAWILLPLILNLLAGSILWRNAEKIAGRMVAGDDTSPQTSATGKELQVVAFSALGLYTLLQVIPQIAELAMRYATQSQEEAEVLNHMRGYTSSELASTVVQMALGIWLLLGAASLAQLVQSFRTVGMDPQNRATIDS